jgi:hypothetical protein
MPTRPSSRQRSISSSTPGVRGSTDMNPMRRLGASAQNAAVEELVSSGR